MLCSAIVKLKCLRIAKNLYFGCICQRSQLQQISLWGPHVDVWEIWDVYSAVSKAFWRPRGSLDGPLHSRGEGWSQVYPCPCYRSVTPVVLGYIYVSIYVFIVLLYSDLDLYL